MLTINYKDILEADDIPFAISYQRQRFVQDFMKESENEDTFDAMKTLMDLYDQYWNSRMDLLLKNGLSEQFAIKNIIYRSLVEASFNQYLIMKS